MIPISKPKIADDEIDSVVETLKSGMIAQGKKVADFEKQFSGYIGTNAAVATNNGTSALHTALLAAGIKQGDEVITTAFSFIATSNSVLYCNAKPRFVDVKEDFNIDPEKINEAITSKTKAIIPVHLYGNPCDMKAVMEIAEDHNLVVVEDACQAHGAEFNGKKVGSFGVGCFSMYPSKNMTTAEGGMITTNEEKIEKNARLIINHGMDKQYHHVVLGYNYRMTDINASIGLGQLEKLETFVQKRIKNAEFLSSAIKANGIIVPKPKERHVYNQYTVRVTEGRDDLFKLLNENGVGARIYYPDQVPEQPLYKHLGFNADFPVAKQLTKEVLSLPVHPYVSKEELNKIAELINNA